MRRVHLFALATLFGCSAAQAGAGGESLESPPDPPPMIQATGSGYTFRLARDQGVAVASIEGRQPDVFQALMRAYDELDIEIGGANQASGTIQSEKIATSRQYAGERMSELFHCGRSLTGERADTWRLQIEIASQAQHESTDRTRLTTRVTATARTMDGTSTNPVPCTTRGKLEQKIAATTALLLALGR
jgi:hypothetical protein